MDSSGYQTRFQPPKERNVNGQTHGLYFIFFLLEHPFSAIPLVSLLPALALYLALGLSPLQLLYTWLAGELFFFLFFFVSFVSFLYVEVPLRFPPPPKRLRRSLAG